MAIYLVDEGFSKAESFAVVDGKIAATGTTEEILKKYSSENIVDVNGKFVYPGFNDAHCHFNGYANNLAQFADLRETKKGRRMASLSFSPSNFPPVAVEPSH